MAIVPSCVDRGGPQSDESLRLVYSKSLFMFACDCVCDTHTGVLRVMKLPVVPELLQLMKDVLY